MSPSALFLGAVFGILAFVGFEGAATMGEEAREPRRTIPKAIFGTVLIGGTFYVFAAAVEVMGYGADKAGLARFEASGSLFGGLGSRQHPRPGSATWSPSAPWSPRWPA